MGPMQIESYRLVVILGWMKHNFGRVVGAPWDSPPEVPSFTPKHLTQCVVNDVSTDIKVCANIRSGGM